MTRLQEILGELAALGPTPAPVLTVSLDLSPGPDGIPSARQVLKQGWRSAEEHARPEHDDLRSYLEDQRAVEQLQEEAIGEGAAGLFYAGCAAAGLRISVETPYPLRNSIQLGRPWLFELVRYQYLMDRPIVVAMVDLGGIRALRVEHGEVGDTIEVEHWTGAVGSARGRTDTQGIGSPGSDGGGAPATGARGGPAADTMGGRHGKTRIESSILAHQQAYARENAAQLAELAGPDDILLICGPEEPRSELMLQLPAALRERAVEAPQIDPTVPESQIADDARAVAVAEQYARAQRQHDVWASGDLGARAIAGVDGIRSAIERGQLGTLLLREDAVPHLGTADDAREHAGLLDERTVNDLVLGALSVSAEILVMPADPERAPQDASPAVAGILRWA